RLDHIGLPQPYCCPNCWLAAKVRNWDVQPPQFMLTAKPFCSKPPPKLPAIALTSRWISVSLVSATGCHQRNFTRVAAGGLANEEGEKAGNASGPGPPGSGALSARAAGVLSAKTVASVVKTVATVPMSFRLPFHDFRTIAP